MCAQHHVLKSAANATARARSVWDLCGPRGRGPMPCEEGSQQTARRPGAGRSRSHHLQVFRRGLAAIAHEFVLDLLTFVQRAQAGTLDSRHMHENVLTAVRRLNEAVAFGRVKPLDSSASHYRIS